MGSTPAGGAHSRSPKPFWGGKQDGVEWVGHPLAPDEAKRRWPHRTVVRFSKDARRAARKRDTDAEPLDAVAHFTACTIEGEADDVSLGTISVGDFVEMYTEREDEMGQPMQEATPIGQQRQTYVVQIQEMFEDIRGDRWMGMHWFYKPYDTALRICEKRRRADYVLGLNDPRRLFRAAPDDNGGYPQDHELHLIVRKVQVEHIAPGMEPPPLSPENDGYYWFDAEHDRRFFSFSTSFSQAPASRAVWQNPSEARKLQALELYCGCGGLSFMDSHSDRVQVETRWAVDFDEAMCHSFAANYGDYTKVYHTGVDEFLWLCKKFQALSDQYPDDWAPPSSSGNGSRPDSRVKRRRLSGAFAPAKRQKAAAGNGRTSAAAANVEPQEKEYEVEAILDLRLNDSAERGKKGQEKGNLIEGLTESQCWLEFLVKWVGYKDPTWEHLDNLANCPTKVAAFVQQTRLQGGIPMRGCVNIVMGGPPCQGISGLNRHRTVGQILDDSKNRQVLAFYKTVQYFRPEYVLMENVLDILKNNDGTYAKFAIGQLLEMRYQARLGVIPAAQHGVPQGRYRAFVWGAQCGEQLPPFPEPTHRMGLFHTSVPVNAQGALVDFTSAAARATAYPPQLMGDVLSDLPEISNFSMAEAQEYECEPQTPFQLHSRRQPPPWQRGARERASAADGFMRPSQQALLNNIAGRLGQHQDRHIAMETVGQLFLCGKDPMKGVKDFASQTWQAFLEEVAMKQRDGDNNMQGLMAVTRRKLCSKIGKQVVGELQRALTAGGPLRDHRALCCNLDDWQRCCSVPSGKGANFRDFEGVVTHGSRDQAASTCCAGHQHAARNPAGGTRCPGGGTYTQAPATNRREGRVDAHDEAGWRGTSLTGCPARTVFLPTGDLLAPRWVITYKKGKSRGRQGCFGRIWYDELQPTVVGRAEPHNLCVVHPTQDRVLSIRENARCQGFPDYFALVGVSKGSGVVRSELVTKRYQQMGNAVCPAVASALGRCLAMAAVGEAPPDAFVVPAPDTEYDETVKEARQRGLKFYSEVIGYETAKYDKKRSIMTAEDEEEPALADDGEAEAVAEDDDEAELDDDEEDDGGQV